MGAPGSHRAPRDRGDGPVACCHSLMVRSRSGPRLAGTTLRAPPAGPVARNRLPRLGRRRSDCHVPPVGRLRLRLEDSRAGIRPDPLRGWEGCASRTFPRVPRVLRLRITVFGDDDEDPHTGHASFDRLFTPGTPLIVASRHGGPGDSLILPHLLFQGARREPRIVLKDTIRWDPAIDTLSSRVPSRFITPSGFGGRAPGSTTAAEQIGDLAMGLDENDALVIFPEGGQISPRRRSQRIERLRSSGLDEFADRAEDLLNVMPPQPAGLNAALAAAPDADMIFIAHTGLDHFQNIGDTWRGLPMNKQLIMRAWRVPRSEIPEEREAQAEWLFGWFERIDFWIADRTATDDPDLP